MFDCCGLGGLGLGFGDECERVLSQQTEPLWQLDVLGIKTDGRSQKAAIILSKQKPGHLGSGGVGDGWIDVGE